VFLFLLCLCFLPFFHCISLGLGVAASSVNAVVMWDMNCMASWSKQRFGGTFSLLLQGR
jgi:Zn-finger protein